MELLKKLGWKDQTELLLVGMPDDLVEVRQALHQGPAVVKEPSDGAIRFLLAFVRHRDEIEHVLQAYGKRLDEQALTWFAYPKKTSKRYSATIDRDHGWEPLGTLLYEPVRQIAIDEDWSALRFKPVHTIATMVRHAKDALSEAGRTRLERDKG